MTKRGKRGIVILAFLLLLVAGVFVLLVGKNRTHGIQEGTYSIQSNGVTSVYTIAKADGKWKLVVDDQVTDEKGNITTTEYWGIGESDRNDTLRYTGMNGYNHFNKQSKLDITIRFQGLMLTVDREMKQNEEKSKASSVAFRDGAYDLDSTRVIWDIGVLIVMVAGTAVLSFFGGTFFLVKKVRFYIMGLAAAAVVLIAVMFFGKDYSGEYVQKGDHDTFWISVSRVGPFTHKVREYSNGEMYFEKTERLQPGLVQDLGEDVALLSSFSGYLDRVPERGEIQVTSSGFSLFLQRGDHSVTLPLESTTEQSPWWVSLFFLLIPMVGGFILYKRGDKQTTLQFELERYCGNYILNGLKELPNEQAYMKEYMEKNTLGNGVVIEAARFQMGDFIWEQPVYSLCSEEEMNNQWHIHDVPKEMPALKVTKIHEEESYLIVRDKEICILKDSGGQITSWTMEVAE